MKRPLYRSLCNVLLVLNMAGVVLLLLVRIAVKLKSYLQQIMLCSNSMV